MNFDKNQIVGIPEGVDGYRHCRLCAGNNGGCPQGGEFCTVEWEWFVRFGTFENPAATEGKAKPSPALIAARSRQYTAIADAPAEEEIA